MKRVHGVLALLQPVAGRVDRVRDEVVVLDEHRVEVRELGHPLRIAQVCEHEPLQLDGRIGPLEDLAPDGASGRLARRLQDGAVDVEVPAVVAAPDAALLDAPVLQRRPPVGAVAVQQSDAATAVPEHHEVLAEDAHGDREVAELRGHGHRQPEPPHVLAAGGLRADVGQLVVLRGKDRQGMTAVRPGCASEHLRHCVHLDIRQ